MKKTDEKRMPKNMFKVNNTAAVGHGRPKLTEIEREVREAMREKIAEVAKLLTISKSQAKKELKKKNGSLLHEFLDRAIRSDNFDQVERSFISRMIGSNKQFIESEVKDSRLDLSHLTVDELEQYAKLVDKATRKE